MFRQSVRLMLYLIVGLLFLSMIFVIAACVVECFKPSSEQEVTVWLKLLTILDKDKAPVISALATATVCSFNVYHVMKDRKARDSANIFVKSVSLDNNQKQEDLIVELMNNGHSAANDVELRIRTEGVVFPIRDQECMDENEDIVKSISVFNPEGSVYSFNLRGDFVKYKTIEVDVTWSDNYEYYRSKVCRIKYRK